jgi:predicted TIM-barrel fold metal-dependent hydrolase
MRMRIIDAHAHCWLPERDSSDLTPVRELLGEMDDFGVEKSLVLSTQTNDRTLTITAVDPMRLHPVASLDPTKGLGPGLRFIERHSSRIRAIKLYPGYDAFHPQEEGCGPIYAYAEDKGLPVLFHSGDFAFPQGRLKYSLPIHLDDVAVQHPQMKIVICHMGNPWIMDAAEIAAKNPNVYLDISGLLEGSTKYAGKYVEWLCDQISKAIYYIGDARKMLFGSDRPANGIGDAIELVKKLDIDEEDRELIYYENAQRLFFSR